MAVSELPPRLPLPQGENVLFQHFRTGAVLRELMQWAVAGTGVSGEEYAVLGVIGFFPDRTPTDLAGSLGIPPTSVSRHVARFVEDGLVERHPNPEDGRSYLLRPTKRGSEVVATVAPRVGELVQALGAASEQPLADIAAAQRALEDAARVVAAERK